MRERPGGMLRLTVSSIAEVPESTLAGFLRPIPILPRYHRHGRGVRHRCRGDLMPVSKFGEVIE